MASMHVGEDRDVKASTIDEYIGSCPEGVQEILGNIRRTIRTAAPGAVETISYGMPTFDLHGRHLVFFAAWKRHISLYPLPAGDAALQQEMARYKQARGSIQFPLDKPIPYDLVGDMVAFLIREKPERLAGDAADPDRAARR